MKPEPSFFEEEIRCGYTVSAAMKRVWSIQLELLAVFQRVCREQGLRYFAAGGTLLGAVRHGGYIPWDDDIDLVMLRADYERFLKEFNRENGCLKVMHWSMDGAYPPLNLPKSPIPGRFLWKRRISRMTIWASI